MVTMYRKGSKSLDLLLVQNKKVWCRAIHTKSRSVHDNGVVQPSDKGTTYVKLLSSNSKIFENKP